MSKKILLPLALMCSTLTLAAATMVSSGKSSWQIVISPRATSTEVYAANELQAHLLEMSKAKLPIVKSDTIPAKNAIVIGFAKTMPALPADLTKFETAEQDTLRVAYRNGNLYCVGNSHRSALYAVYAFLKNVCGVRWYRPGKGWDGTFFPKKAVIDFSDTLDFTEQSSFKYRGFHMCGKHYDHEMETWMTRNRINIMRSDPVVPKAKWRRAWNDTRIAKGLYMMFATHNVAIYDKKVFAEHPEYFAEINGKRISDQLCWSNPDVDKILIDRFVQFCKESPELEILNLSAADNMNYCRCSKCGKLPVNELWFALFQRIIDGVAKECPNVKFATLAYQAYIAPPKKPLRNVAFVEYCMYNRCYVHTYAQCNINERPMKQIREWQAQGTPILIYGYEFDIFKPAMQPPFYHMLADQMRHFKPAKLYGAITEVSPPHPMPKGQISGGKMRELGYYVYAALLWQHDADVEKIIAEYSDAAFGAAGKELSAYAIALSKAWGNMKNHYSYFYNSPMACSENLFTPALITKLENHFRTAEKIAKTVKCPVERKRISANIAAEKAVFNLWVKTYREYTASKNSAKVMVPVSKKPMDFTNAAIIPAFIGKPGATKVPKTVAKVNYDSKNLYFDVTCYDENMKNIKAVIKNDDGGVYNDDCIEIFIAVPNDTQGIYRHLIANSLGVKYDSIALGGHTFNQAWNPKWTVKPSKGKNFWRLQIAIPFAGLGNTPKAGDSWSFSIKRSNGNRRDLNNSGFPEASYHDQNAFGLLQFTPHDRPVSAVIFYPAKPDSAREMKTLMEQSGFATTLYRDIKQFNQHKAANDIYIIRFHRGLKLDQKVLDNVVIPALKNGALVLFAGWGENLKADKFFHDPALALKWSGWKIDRKRKSRDVKIGPWFTTPNDLRSTVQRGMTPSSGFKPLTPAAWNDLGSLTMENNSVYSFMLTRKIGKGLLVISSIDFGISGGHAMFGSRKQSSQQLLENLFQLTKSQNK